MSEHMPICGECFEPWPCLHQRQYADRLWKERRAREACHRCGRGVTGMSVNVPGGGLLGESVLYHGRQGACRKAGLKHLEDVLAQAADPLLRLQLEKERDRLDEEALRGRAEQEARRLRKIGGTVLSREEADDRLITRVRLDGEELAIEWRKGTNPPDDLVLHAACSKRAVEIAKGEVHV
jgi:hypothetical protein